MSWGGSALLSVAQDLRDRQWTVDKLENIRLKKHHLPCTCSIYVHTCARTHPQTGTYTHTPSIHLCRTEGQTVMDAIPEWPWARKAWRPVETSVMPVCHSLKLITPVSVIISCINYSDRAAKIAFVLRVCWPAPCVKEHLWRWGGVWGITDKGVRLSNYTTFRSHPTALQTMLLVTGDRKEGRKLKDTVDVLNTRLK